VERHPGQFPLLRTKVRVLTAKWFQVFAKS
jgi:hypothetical protein